MTATTDAHTRIEASAARLLDATPALLRNRTLVDAAVRAIDNEQRNLPFLDLLAAATAMTHGKSTRVQYERGPELALLTAAVLDAVFGRTRTPLRWCPHRDGLTDSRLTLLHTPLRFAGCPDCASVEAMKHAADLETDNSCDVCDTDHGSVVPRVFPLGQLMITLYSGPCCDELFTYATPVSTFTVRSIGRNEPCPCGSGRKAKCCHGSAVRR